MSPKRIPPELSTLEYTTTPDSNLVCLICHAPFDRPVQLPCEHYFCRECLTHAWAPSAHKTCPTCRGAVDDGDVRPVPKIVETMLDELVVKCPHSRKGCSWTDQRGHVRDHVLRYCEHTPVECPAADCSLPTTQRAFDRGCLHYTVSCEDCRVSLMQQDLEEHQRSLCPNRSTSCDLCSAVLLRLDLATHINTVCPQHVVPCAGAVVGCSFRAARADVTPHEAACAMAAMAPHFREQQARLERTEARLEPLARKVGILEDGLANMTNMLYPSTTNEAFASPEAAQEPPFDSQVHHLLTLHENLRDEVARIATSLTDVEGRANMMIINESQRTKDELLHTNAAINNMRMQLHWLMSATIQQRARSGSISSSMTSSVPSSVANSVPSSIRSSVTNSAPTPYRRLSDSNRQDTKL